MKRILATFLFLFICSSSIAASMDDNITCALVYGALFQAAKDSNDAKMIAYSKPRLQVVLPFLQENQENPEAKKRLKEIAASLDSEVRVKMVGEITRALKESNERNLKKSMSRVSQCDKKFGLSSTY